MTGLISEEHVAPPETGAFSDQRYRQLVEVIKDYAIFLLDENGFVRSWNTGAQQIKGYTEAEIIGKHFSIFYPPEAIARAWPQNELKLAIRDGRFEEEGWRLRKDGTRFWANVVITPVVDSDGVLRGFAKVTRDLTQRRRMEQLEEEGRQMNQFLAMLAHELRNPLAPIQNAVGILQARRIDDPTIQWSRDVIDRQVRHLTRLVDDLLDVTRITRGIIQLHPEPVDVEMIINRAIEISRPNIDARHHRLDVTMPANTLMVNGDLTRLSQVVMNLLNNSAKYTPERGVIKVWTTSDEKWLRIHVSDNGVGIPESVMPTIFNLFEQGEHTADSAGGGLGIGLTLVKQLVELHGGIVIATSRGKGTGSEFVVHLPVLNRSAHEITEGGNNVATLGHAAGLRVIVVDDNKDSAESMGMLLRIWGHDVRINYDGETALAAALEWRPDVMILDIGLPNLSGHDVARKLREQGLVPPAVLIAVTGYGKGDDRTRSREAGFSYHLVKPVDATALRDLLDMILERTLHN